MQLRSSRQFIYLLLIVIGNISLFLWTYRACGYGALAAMFMAPLLNGGGVLLFAIVIRLLKFKNKAELSEINVPLVFSLAFMVIMEILAMTVYSHGGC